MKLTENTKVRVKVPKHLYEAIQAELDKKQDEAYDKDNMEEADDNSQSASVEEIAIAMDKAVAFAKKLAQQIANKKGGSLTQKDFHRLIDNFRYKVKDFGPFKRAAEPEATTEEIEEAFDLNTLMEAVKEASKKKAAKKIADKKAEEEKKKEAKIAADKKATMEKKKAVAAKKK